MRRRLRRIRLHLPMALAVLALAHPTPQTLTLGTALVFLGMLLRWWAAGVLIKGGGLCVFGPYQYVRHPLYLGSTLGAVGLCIMASNPWAWAVVLPVFLLIYAWQIGEEEQLLAQTHREDHATWAARVPKLLPRPTPLRPTSPRPWTLHQALANREHFHILVTALLVALFYLKPLLVGA